MCMQLECLYLGLSMYVTAIGKPFFGTSHDVYANGMPLFGTVHICVFNWNAFVWDFPCMCIQLECLCLGLSMYVYSTGMPLFGTVHVCVIFSSHREKGLDKQCRPRSDCF